ncbi:MAG: hypothetical protein ACI9T7_002013 [Oleiphilaceae bacterium]|jgi:hypothetical protein
MQISMKNANLNLSLLKTTLLVVALQVPLTISAIEKIPEEDLKKEAPTKPRINFQISAPHKAKTYSCKLLQHAFQCREYKIIPTAKHILNDLKESCGSMGGNFEQLHCPSSKYISVCSEIIRNLHKPDVIYNTFYYGGNQSLWDIESTQRVCGNLGGTWLKELK